MAQVRIQPRRKILFVELLGGIGDVLIALGAIQALSRSYPEAEVTVLTLPPGGELLENDPRITQVLYADQGNPRKSVEVLLSHQFDLIVSDTNYDGIDQLIQNSGAARVVTNLWRQPPPDQRVSDRFLQILLAEGLIENTTLPSTTLDLYLTLDEQRSAQEALGFCRRPLIFLFPDAGMEIKRWSTENFVSLGQTLQQRYGATIIVPVGSDLQQATGIADAIGNTQVLPRGKLRNLAAAIACADLVVAADTGAARIAAALDVPTITLFGPSWHGRYGQPSPHINLQGYPECSERVIGNFTEQRCWYESICPLDKNWRTCLEAISPADVLAAATPFLEKNQEPA